jgi:outer membrane protein assembly factor BamE (lipoprotein component of BamABCDE complex)
MRISAGPVIVMFTALMLGISGCFTYGNKQGRTVDDAKWRFPDASLIEGKTTKDEVRSAVGSPNQIRKLDGGEEQWIYVKTEEVDTSVITTDVGTNYVAEFRFASNGILKDKNYRAESMNSPLR